MQPNCRCPYCETPFFIDPTYKGFVDCNRCNGKFKDTDVRIKPKK